MSTQLTPKQERFCQLYLELGNASEAYRQVYAVLNSKPSTVHRRAKALLDHAKIRKHLTELKQQHQQRHQLSVDSLIAELEEARLAALSPVKGRIQVTAAIAATMGKARLVGLDKQVTELTGANGTALAVPVFHIVGVQPNDYGAQS